MHQKRAKLGILFVHGIGEQPQGHTLWYFGEPLVHWLDRWLKRGRDEVGDSPDHAVAITEAVVNPAQRQLNDPAHAWLDVAMSKQPPLVQRWLLAESWWGAELQQPAFNKVAAWMLTTGTWMIISHTLWRSRLKKKSWWLQIQQFAAAVAALFIAGLTQLAVLALMVLALIPVERLQHALSGLLLALAGVLGDSYVFVENRIQRAAIVTKVRENLRWLGQQCDSVVVIAHSQGAAVAHEALQDAEPQNVKLLVTVGSGLAKLKQLESVADMYRGRLLWTAISIPFTILAALIAVRSHTHTAELSKIAQWLNLFPFVSWISAILAFGSLFTTVLFVQKHAEEMQRGIDALSLRHRRKGIRWFDIYASRDPVPNGPLAKRGQIRGFSTQAVTSGMSILQDHTSYWENSADLFPKIFRKMDLDLQLGLFQGRKELEQLKSAAVRHRKRVWWKVAAFWANVLSAILFIACLWKRGTLVDLGSNKIWPALDQGAFAFLGKSLAAASQLGEVILSWVFGPKDFRSLGMGLLGATLPLALTMVWYLAFRKVWGWWEEFAVQRLFVPQSVGVRKGKGDDPIIALLVIAAGLFPLVLAILLIVTPGRLAPAKLEEEALLILGSALVIWLGFVLLVMIFSAAISLYKSPPAERKQSAATLFYSIGVAVFWCLFLVSPKKLPLLQTVKDWSVRLFSFGASLTVAVYCHSRLLRMALKGPYQLIWWVALLLPVLLPVLLSCFVAVSLLLSTHGGSETVPDIMFGFSGSYLLSVALAWPVVRLSTRKERSARKQLANVQIVDDNQEPVTHKSKSV